MNEWMNEWMNECMNEWMNEWMSEWMKWNEKKWKNEWNKMKWNEMKEMKWMTLGGVLLFRYGLWWGSIAVHLIQIGTTDSRLWGWIDHRGPWASVCVRTNCGTLHLSPAQRLRLLACVRFLSPRCHNACDIARATFAAFGICRIALAVALWWFWHRSLSLWCSLDLEFPQVFLNVF